MLLEGLFLPLTTPYLPDGQLNLRKLQDNVVRYSKTPAAGMAVLTRIGQPTLLSDTETREALRVVAETAASEKVLLVGVARDSVVNTLELIEYAASVGYDAALVPVPSTLWRSSARRSDELLNFFKAVADAAALPIVLDSAAEGYGEIEAELMIELAGHRNIIGAVDENVDASRIGNIVSGTATIRHEATVTLIFAAVTRRMLAKSQPTEAALFVSADSLSGGGTSLSIAPPPAQNKLKTRSKSVDFQVLCGRTAGVLDALLVGAVGALPPLAASAPQVCYEVLAAWKDGDPALAAEKQDRIMTVAARVEEQLGLSGIKYGCDLNGYFGGRPRLPTLPLTGAEREEVEALMAGIRN